MSVSLDWPVEIPVAAEPEGPYGGPVGRMPNPMDAINECEHGRLPHQACACFEDAGVRPIRHEEIVPQPTRHATPAITTEEARELVTGVATTTADPDAPWGRKKDGSPRKRPGRQPKRKRRAVRPASPAVSTAEARVLISPAPEITASIDARLAALRDEEARLVKARTALVG